MKNVNIFWCILKYVTKITICLIVGIKVKIGLGQPSPKKIKKNNNNDNNNNNNGYLNVQVWLHNWMQYSVI